MTEPSRSDARLYIRALRQGWNIPAKKRTGIIQVLFDMVQDQAATPRERTAAARALMQASRLELDAIRVVQGTQYEDMVRRLEAIEGEGGGDGELARPAGEA
jgi:hypothetical protein